MSLIQAIIASNVDSGRGFSAGVSVAYTSPEVFKSACHFHPKIHVHRRVPMGRMMIQEYVCPSVEAPVAPQEFPDLIQGGTPDGANSSDCHLSPNGGQFPRLNELD